MKRTAVTVLAFALAVCLTGCGEKKDGPLDSDHPVSLTIWHYYHGAQQNAFDSLVDEFNSTVGKEKGIYVEGISQGSVSDLEEAVRDSLQGKVGSEEMPDIFAAYADVAYEVEREGALANLSDYLTDEDMEDYIEAYVEEGEIAEDGTLRIFPVAKSTEIMMLNQTDWEPFAEATGARLEDLSTLEGVVKTAEAYYKWTDDLTPDVPNDGKAFYGIDSVANYFSVGMMQLGNEIFQVENSEVTLNTDKESLKRIWECFYVPMVKGYFGAYGSYRSDDVKTGDLLAYTGSTASVMYFPDEVEKDGERYPIDYLVLPVPIFEGGENYTVQQGAGMVVSKSDEAHEYASVEFLKWFTQPENDMEFCAESGYLPVLKDGNNTELLDQTIKDKEIEVSEKSYDCLNEIFSEMDYMKMYTNKSFRNGSAARKVLEYNLYDKALADRVKIEEQLAEGVSLEEACAPYLSDEDFEEWYEDFCTALTEAAAQ
jgi:multiple sugar transport system substrate-binding protein